MSKNPTPQRVSFSEDDEGRLDEIGFHNDYYDSVLLFDGDVVLDGDFLSGVEEIANLDGVDAVAITGDLTVNGPIHLGWEDPGLYVGGFTRAESLQGGDPEISIQDGSFTYLVHGYGNDGILEACTVKTPWVINDNHHLDLHAPGAHLVDYWDDDADFHEDNIRESFVPDVLDPESGKIDVDAFLGHLQFGGPVLRPGAQTATEAALAEAARARADQAPSVDLSGRKLKEFPADLLRMPWLRKLVLDGNPIGQLPDEIGTLTNLEHLSVRNCGLSALPPSIGQLSKLRFLRVAGNRGTELLDTIGLLTALEVLDISGVSSRLPDTVGNLARLRRLVADNWNRRIPASMRGLPSLEEVSMAGSTMERLTEFPEALATFPNLRKLNLRNHSFKEIPEALLRLTNLEELNLGSSLGLVETPLPDLSLLPRLRVLRLDGSTGRTSEPHPSHTLLRPVFGMRLAALEELGIDRWGTDKESGRGPMTADVIAGIGAFRSLRRIDLSFNDLASLPDDFYTLPAVEQIDLRFNSLPGDVRRRVAAAYPQARIDFRDQRDVDGDAEREQLRAVNTLIEQANALRGREKWSAALTEYDKAITHYTNGDADSAYGLLYAYYGKMWIHSKLGYFGDGTEQDKARHRRDGVSMAEACMRLVPPVWQIPHFTDRGHLEREVVRRATDMLAWEVVHADPAPTPEDLTNALQLIERGVACTDGSEHIYVHNTHARVLLALGREAEAWRVVQRALALDPTFDQLQDLKQDRRYQAWIDKTEH